MTTPSKKGPGKRQHDGAENIEHSSYAPALPKGLTREAWRAIGAEPDGKGWKIPEFDADGVRIGWATRSADGEKSSQYGSKRGLTMALPLPTYAGTSKDDPVFVVEGATDTAAGTMLELTTIGRPGVSGGINHLASLKRDHFVFIGENDGKNGKPGPGQTDTTRAAMKLASSCKSVRIIFPPADVKDLRAWAIKGATRIDVFNALEAAEPIQPIVSDESLSALEGSPILLSMADVESTPVSWLWPSRIPRGRITVLVGRPGDGKSFASADWAARISKGTTWPDGAPCECGNVLLVSGEDDPGDTIRPRLEAHEADVSRIHLLSRVRRLGREGMTDVCFTLADIEAFATALKRVNPVLAIIDPIGSFLGGKVDAHRDNEVRGVLAPIVTLAREHGTAIVLVAHQRKGSAVHADDLVLGSRAFTALARSVLHLLRDPTDNARRLLLPGKTNLTAPPAGLAFSIEGEPARLLWDAKPVTMSADQVLRAEAGAEGGGTAVSEAVEWLRQVLQDGPLSAKDLHVGAKEAGIKWGAVRKAKKVLGVLSKKVAYGEGWLWKLDAPNVSDPSEGAQGNSLSALGDDVHLGEDLPSDACQ